ncbi:MAG: class I SAM-dependent methyltransferase [Ignavibacteria bacterium]|nr:class I SAM-dependent methyltransferase [Ignavibacteria bacterium]
MKCEICFNETKLFFNQNGILPERCGKCGHIFIKHSDSITGIREEAWGGNGFFDQFRILLTWMRLKNIKIEENSNVFEIGYGNGVLLEKFHKKGNKIGGAEAGLLKNSVPEYLKNNAELYYGDFENLEIPKNKFDLIYGIHLIEHIKDSNAFLKKCNNLLSKNGKVYFITPNSMSLGARLFKSSWWNFEDPTHIQFFNPVSARISLMNAGFKEIKTKILLTDSLMVEVNSILRMLGKKSGKSGVMDSYISKAAGVFLLPVSLILRILIPALSPSIEISAVKE